MGRLIIDLWRSQSQKSGNILAKLLIRTAGVDDENWESDEEDDSDGPQTMHNEETHLTGDLDQKASISTPSHFTVALMYFFIGESTMVALGKAGEYD